jgi:hypothetical protein
VNYLTVRSRFATQGLISSHGLRRAFPDFDKRRLAEQQAPGYLQRIVNRWYRFTKMPVDEVLLWFTATRIYQPAYLSRETALSYHVLIPEGIHAHLRKPAQNPGVPPPSARSAASACCLACTSATRCCDRPATGPY